MIIEVFSRDAWVTN